ncbi:putative heavy metal-associated domain, HMA, heavy metal-associated domain superfamily [Helianthus annuus]|nr:putative heavy metal-associated domain, HMA, heavy metal-associated domain superfamily [Helianthus annuus]
MTIILQIVGFHNCDGCAKKVRITLRRIGVKLVELDRETGNATIETAENPEVIRRDLARQLKKSVVVLSRDPVLVPANQIPNSIVSHQVLANQTLDLEKLGQVMLRLAQDMDGVEIINSNTMRINFVHREISPLVIRPEPRGNIGEQITGHADVVKYAPRQPPHQSPPWVATEPSAPLMPMGGQAVYDPLDYYGSPPWAAPLMPMVGHVVYGYPLDFYGVSTSGNHDHPNGGCTIK